MEEESGVGQLHGAEDPGLFLQNLEKGLCYFSVFFVEVGAPEVSHYEKAIYCFLAI